MILRKAELKDFQVFKKLYEDENENYNWLYIDSKKDQIEISKEEKKKIEEDFKEILDYYSNYTLERFERDLKIEVILVIELDSKVIGYLILFQIKRGVYKIAEWGMLENENSKKTEVLRCLLSTKIINFSTLQVTTISSDAINFLLENGFKPLTTIGFYSIEMQNKKGGR